MIYFDNSATSFLKPESVHRAVSRAMRVCANPGRGGYRAAMRAAETVYRCREAAASLFDCGLEAVVFTMNATHGLNMAIKSLVSPGDRVVVSGFEHNSVMRPLYHLGADVEVAGRRLFRPENTVAAFRSAITEDTRAVVCTHVSNVFGYVLPVGEIAALCRERNVPFVLDASQSAGCLPVSLRALSAAFIAMPGHKGLYGPQGTGLLLCGMPLKTLMEGGSGSQSREKDMPDFLPDRGEAGTQNVVGIAGLLAGIQFVAALGVDKMLSHGRTLTDAVSRELSGIGAIRQFYSERECQAGVLSLTASGLDCELIAEALSNRQIASRAGLHCAPLAHESAGTLESGTLRLSPSFFSTMKEAEHVASVLRRLVQNIDGKSLAKMHIVEYNSK